MQVDDDFTVHLRTDHGLKILTSIATSSSDDVDLQAQALIVLANASNDPRISLKWEELNILKYILEHEALVDPEHDLHLVLWKCLAKSAENSLKIVELQWSQRTTIFQAAENTSNNASLQSTSMMAHAVATLVCRAAQDFPKYFEGTTSPFVDLGDASDGGLGFCERVKQWYVLTNEAALLSMLGHLTKTHAEIKIIYSSGIIRLVCHDYLLHHENFDFHDGCFTLLDKILSILCPHKIAPTTDRFLHTVMLLSLSKVKAIRLEMQRVLRHITENSHFSRLLVKEPHFRGVLAHFNAHDGSDQVLGAFVTEIDTFERENGSLIGLPKLEIDLSEEDAIETATKLKKSGNVWFSQGNNTAARSFYRLALSTLAVADANANRRAILSPSPPFNLSIGHNVQVQQLNGSWLVGIIGDINNESADVLYDNGSEEDEVMISRIRLVHSDGATELRMDLCMNSAKCLHGLKQTHEAIECLSFALERMPGYIPGLYLRGILSMSLHDTKQSKNDLQQAHELISKSKTHFQLVGDIRKAWSRLQLIVKHRKRADKRMIKEMIKYINTIVE